jgi:hypothetical protein
MRMTKLARNLAFVFLASVFLFSNARLRADGAGASGGSECRAWVWGTTEQSCGAYFRDSACYDVYHSATGDCAGFQYYNPNTASAGECTEDPFDHLFYSDEDWACWHHPIDDGR